MISDFVKTCGEQLYEFLVEIIDYTSLIAKFGALFLHAQQISNRDGIKNGKPNQNLEDTTGRCIQTRCFFNRDTLLKV